MSLLSGIATQQDRGTADNSLSSIAKRLTEVAKVAYEDERFSRSFARLDGTFLRPAGGGLDTPFYAVLSNVGAYKPHAHARDRAYFADLNTLMALVEQASYGWLNRSLTAQAKKLETLRAEFMASLGALHEDAREYVGRRDSLPKEMKRVPSAKTTPSEETAESVRRREEQARVQSHPWLEVLLRHPRRYALVNSIARGETEAAAALEKAFIEAQKGLHEFRQRIHEEPEHIWRYWPVVAGGCAELGLFPEGGPLLLRFMRDIAVLRSKDKWESLYTVAGIAIAGLSLLTGPLGIAIIVLDIGLTIHIGWKKFEREDENDIASAAQAFAAGEELTDRPSDYGSIALEGAMALLGAFQLVAMLRGARAAMRAERAAAETRPAGTAAKEQRAVESAPSDRGLSARGAEPKEKTLERDTPSSGEAGKKTLKESRDAALPGCKYGSVDCNLKQLTAGVEDIRKHFELRPHRQYEDYIRDIRSPRIEIMESPRSAAARYGGPKVLSGDGMYIRFLEMDQKLWSPAFRRELSAIERNGVQGVDYREIVRGTRVYRWPISKIDGRPWEIHHDPPLYVGGQDSEKFLYALPDHMHREFTDWWRKLVYQILRHESPATQREIMSLEEWHRLELDFGG